MNDDMNDTSLVAEDDSVMLKALHSGALALSRQRRALLRNHQLAKDTVSQIAQKKAFVRANSLRSDTFLDAGDSLCDAASNEDAPTKPLLKGRWSAPELEFAEPRPASRANLEDPPYEDSPQSWLKPRASLEAEVASLSLKHRSYSKRNVGNRKSTKSPTAPESIEQLLNSGNVSPGLDVVPGADLLEGSPSCRVCGDVLSSTQAGRLEHRVAEYREEAHTLSARLEVAEELLRKAKPEAARAKTLQRERDAERVRAEDLAVGLRAANTLSAELKRGFEQQSLDFKSFIANIRFHTDASQGAYLEALQAVHSAKQSSASLATSPRHHPASRDQARYEDELRRELNDERTEYRRSMSRLSEWCSEGSEHKRRFTDLEHRSASLIQELHEHQTHNSSIRRQSTLVEGHLWQLEEHTHGLTQQLQEQQSELLHSRALTQQLRERNSELSTFQQEYVDECMLYRERHTELTSAHEALEHRSVRDRQRREQRLEHINGRWDEVFGAVEMAHKGSQMRIARSLDKKLKPWKDKVICIARNRQGVRCLEWKSLKNTAKWKQFDLKTVTSLQIGKRNIPRELEPVEQPWNFFMVTIAGEPTAFWSHFDDVVKSFIIALSHLCVNLSPMRSRDLAGCRAVYKMGVDRPTRTQNLLHALQRTQRIRPAPKSEALEDNPDIGFDPEPEEHTRHEDAPHPEASSSGVHQPAYTGHRPSPRREEEVIAPSSAHAPEGAHREGLVVEEPRREDVVREGDLDLTMGESGGEDVEEGDEHWIDETQSSTRPGTSRSATSPDDRGHHTSGTEIAE